jgi:pimeloyl-ACP methyl ester carboxylesterase
MAQPKLDGNEEYFVIPEPNSGLRIFLRLLRSQSHSDRTRRVVLYVHGATFPSALSVAYRFDGFSWRDALCAEGFDVWALDFIGFGYSDRYPEMEEPAEAHEPLGLTERAFIQVEAAAKFILEHQGLQSLSIISHSWGSMPTALFAGSHPSLVERIVMFAPIAERPAIRYFPKPTGPAWRIVTAEDQWARFVEDVPPKEPAVLSKIHFSDWEKAYLDSDPLSRTRDIPGVMVPSGPIVEILRAWEGSLPYQPDRLQAPVAIIRGSWDGVVPDADARWLFDAFTNAPVKRDIKISRGTHLMHLETMRLALWRESAVFLLGDDVASMSN